MGIDSVRLKNLVVGRWSNFLLKISLVSMKYELRPSAEVERSRIFEESVCLVPGIQHSFLLHHVPTLAKFSASVSWGLFTLWLWSGGKKCSVWVRVSRGGSCLPGSLLVLNLQSKTLLEICLQHFVIDGEQRKPLPNSSLANLIFPARPLLNNISQVVLFWVFGHGVFDGYRID